jgi:hypothetical protein
MMPLLGYRLWLADSDKLTLASLTFEDKVWPTSGYMRADRRPSHEALYGGYGLHACYHFHHADNMSARYDDSFALWYTIANVRKKMNGIAHTHWVAGVVTAWGEVALHDQVMRAEHMQLLALHYCVNFRDEGYAARQGWGKTPDAPTELKAIAERYDVPVLATPSKLRAYGQEFGREVTPELIG